MTSRVVQLRRVIALRTAGARAWRAKATDGRRVGRGVGGSWEEAVSEAIRQVDERRAVGPQP